MICPNCNIEHDNPKFCSKSCSASLNNKTRVLSSSTKSKISKSLNKKFDLSKLIELIDNKKTVSEISNLMKLSETTIRKKIKDNNLIIYKKPILIKKDTSHINSNLSHCPIHDVEFKIGKTGKKYCTKCNNIAVNKVRINRKIECVMYKGGKCERCRYDKCLSALEFHHTDPNEKDFSISNSDKTSFDILKNELDKCVLVCSNCHREIHEELRNSGSVINWQS